MKTPDFDLLCRRALAALGERRLSASCEAGSVAAALVTNRGSIFVGVCLDAPCGLGFCAEQAAVAAMVTAGESRVEGVVALAAGGPIPPCGRCRELICQLHPGNLTCQVLLPGGRVRVLSELLPDRWEG